MLINQMRLVATTLDKKDFKIFPPFFLHCGKFFWAILGLNLQTFGRLLLLLKSNCLGLEISLHAFRSTSLVHERPRCSFLVLHVFFTLITIGVRPLQQQQQLLKRVWQPFKGLEIGSTFLFLMSSLGRLSCFKLLAPILTFGNVIYNL